MINLQLRSLTALLLVSICSPASSGKYESHFHQHSGSDLDSVQCHHTVYKVSSDGGTPELVNGQESRVEPSRQYLPVKKGEEAPAASFDQPNFLPVEKSFLSPSLQSNFNSLFSQKSKQDTLSPSAAQNVPTIAQRVNSDQKHSHHDDENNLERLCSDAFHSFLCKPITGPRKTPTGRLRPNAVIPPDVLAGLSSFQDARRVRPDIPETPSASNAVGQKYLPPSKPQQLNQVQQNTPLLKSTTTTTRKPPKAYLPPAPFENILIDSPEIPSPSNTNSQVIKLQHDCEKSKPFTPPVEASPSKENSVFVNPYNPSTPKPFPNRFNNAPSTPLPTNNFPKIQQPFRLITPPHDCDKSKLTEVPIVAHPSNNNPMLIKPYNVPSQNPFAQVYSRPTTPRPTVSFTTFPQYSPAPLHHDCDKSKPQFPSFVTKQTSSNSRTKAYSAQTQPLTVSSAKPDVSYFTNDFSKSASTLQQLTLQPNTDHDCDKHKFPVFGASTVQNKIAPKPYSQPSYSQFLQPKQPQSSNNVPQILAQPQQVNTATVSPKDQGYSYNQPAIPFRSLTGSPTFQNPTVAESLTKSSPTTARSYSYNQPRIPFPSDNIAQVVVSPAQPVPTFNTFTTTTTAPCQHHNVPPPTFPLVGKPTNQDEVVVNPGPYIYNKPDVPFPSEKTGSSDRKPVSLKPPVTSTGYRYEKPETPFLLPNPTDNFPNVVASPANNGYTYDTPERQFPPQTGLSSSNSQIVSNSLQASSTQRPYSSVSKGYSYPRPEVPFPTSINSKLALASLETTSKFVAKPQNRVEVKVRPGYSYDKPSELFETPQASNENAGYSYPKPGTIF